MLPLAQLGLPLRRLLLRALTLRLLFALDLLALALFALRLQTFGLRALRLFPAGSLAGVGLAPLLLALRLAATLRLLLLCPLLLLRLLLSLLQLLPCLLLLACLATRLFLTLGLRALCVLARIILLSRLVLAHFGLPAHLLLGVGLRAALRRLRRLGARLETRRLFRVRAATLCGARVFLARKGGIGKPERKRRDERDGPDGVTIEAEFHSIGLGWKTNTFVGLPCSTRRRR